MLKEFAHKIRPLWRWCIAVVSLAGMALMYFSYQVVRSINGQYFHDPRVPLGALDVLAVFVLVYLLLVAIFGRWRIFSDHEAS
jgi:hypothetical protein